MRIRTRDAKHTNPERHRCSAIVSLNSSSHPLAAFSALLAVFDRGAAQSVDHCGLSGPEFDPVCAIDLHLFVEILGSPDNGFGNFSEFFKLALERKLTDERLFRRSAPPYRNCRLALEVTAEMNHADVILHFFNRYIVDQCYPGLGLTSIRFSVGKTRVMSSIPRSSSIFGEIRTHPWEYRLHPAQAITLEQQLFLKLDFVVSAALPAVLETMRSKIG